MEDLPTIRPPRDPSAGSLLRTPEARTKVIILCLWLLASVYFGVGGWCTADVERLEVHAAQARSSQTPVKFRDVEYASIESLKVDLEQRKTEAIFPWIAQLPSFAILSLTALAFGALGACCRGLKELLFTGQATWSTTQFSILPLFGALLGLVMLGISFLIPSALLHAPEFELRPASLFVICLLAGIFSEQVFDWLQQWLRKVF